MKKINTIVKSLFLLVLFYGCRNLADVPFPPSEDGNRECKITAEINFPDGNINTLNSIRAAFPASSLKDSDGKTFVFAGALLPSGTEPGSTDLKAALYASGITVSIPFDYSESARSNYVLHIFAYKNDYDSSSGFDIDKALLHGTGTVASIPAGALSLNSVNVYMYPHSYEKGKVSLQVKIPDSTVYNLVTKCDDAVFDNITVVPESNVCTLSVSDVTPKSYSVKFQLVYITPSEVAYEQTEIINVYPGMKTDKWYKGTSAFSYLDLSAPVKETSFYVCGTFSDYSNSWFHFFKSSDGAEITGNDTTGNGSITKPYATVQKAVDHVLAINDGTSAYTIYVDGNFAAQSGVNYALLADITNIAKTLNLTISSLGTEKSVLKGLDSDGNRIIYCNENSQTVNLTLRNLVFEKGTASNQEGGGAVLFNVSESSKLKIENCVFRQNSHTFGKAINSFQSEIELSGQNDFTTDDIIFKTTFKPIIIGENFSIGSEKIRITKDSWNEGDVVLKASDGVDITDDICGKFSLYKKESDSISPVLFEIIPSADKKTGTAKALSGFAAIEKAADNSTISTTVSLSGISELPDAKTKIQTAVARGVRLHNLKLEIPVYSNTELETLSTFIFDITDETNVCVDLVLTESSTITKIGGKESDSTQGVFQDRSCLTSVQIPSSVVEVTDGAFRNCLNLEKVMLPSTLKVIGLNAFASCKKLSGVNFEDCSVLESVGSSAFDTCEMLSEIVLPDSLLTIGGLAFCATSFSEITIPKNVGYIGPNAFSLCESATNINFASETVTPKNQWYKSSTDEMKYDDSNKIVVSNSSANVSEFVEDEEQIIYYTKTVDVSGAADIMLNAEAESSDVSVTISNVTSDDLDTLVTAIKKCQSQNISVEIASLSGVTSIGNAKFSGCTNLKKIVLPEGLTEIGGSAFQSSGLTEINIPASVRRISSNAFNGTNLTSVKFAVTSGWLEVLTSVATTGNAVSADLSDNSAAANYLKSLTTYLYRSVLSLGNATALLTAATETDELDLTVEISTQSDLNSLGDAISGTDSNSVSLSLQLTSGSTLTVFGSNNSDGYGFCYGDESLKSLSLPEGITVLADQALNGCCIEEIILPSSLTTIGDAAFASCVNLTEITIPASVTKIGYDAFSGCSSYLDKITFESPNGWYSTTSGDYTGGTPIDLSTPEANVGKLTPSTPVYLYKP